MIDGNILTPNGWIAGRLDVDSDGRIASISGVAADPAENQALYVLPGFIDLHVHGGGGADVMEGGAAMTTMARLHAGFGTTALLATTMTAPHETLTCVLTALGDVTRAPRPAGTARVLGVHLEGPYISPAKLGAQPAATVSASREEMLGYLALAPIRVVTLAPEIGGDPDLIEQLDSRGVRVQIGHSAGSYEDGVAALKRGAHGFTHLFNAMTGLHHRDPGMVGAALAHAEYAELIPDLQHVHPGAILTALRAIPRLYAVTDATAAAGMPDGDYQLGSQPVFKCLGCVRLADGTLAGSALTTGRAFANLLEIGLSIEDASNRLSRYPADYLGVADRGRIETGAWADLLVFDRNLTLQQIYIEGERIRPTPGI